VQLNRTRSSWVVAGALAVLAAAGARAENGVVIRGVYYREASTRVIQPVVEISKELPSGVDISAHYLLDAITSASVSAGNATDTIFTEFRNEAGLAVGKTFGRNRVGLTYRYSAESDYWSHGLTLSYQRRVWGDSGTIAGAIGRGFDAAGSRFRTPNCAGGRPGGTCPLDIWFAGAGYTQVITPTAVAQVSYELSYLDGFQGNLYRSVPNHGFEVVPDKRLRHAASVRGAKYFPRTGTGFQAQYRYYLDQGAPVGEGEARIDEPWHVTSHMIEARLFQSLRDVELRFSYRLYLQSAANFWCDWMANPACYGPNAPVYTTDPKLGPVTTHMPEVKVVVDLRALRTAPFFGWFATGSVEASYAHLSQSTSFGDAHLVQTGYAIPF
jgi:hypothetical protein